jgi:hypothetical protein
MNNEDIDIDSEGEAHIPRRCCACGQVKAPCRTIAFLGVKAPIPGTGWACFLCHLPPDGAVAVVCDDCSADETMELQWAIVGRMDSEARMLIVELQGEHRHDLRFHPELAGRN